MNWKTLICEEKDKVSLGRVAFWIALSISIYYWVILQNVMFPATLLEFLMYTLIYNGLKKGVDSYTLTKTTNINDQYKSEIKVDDRSKE